MSDDELSSDERRVRDVTAESVGKFARANRRRAARPQLLQALLRFPRHLPHRALTDAMSHTAKQQEAIESWGRTSVCVTAGPGSGKTRVLTERIRWLARAKRVEPGQILAITFTRKAAASMYRRLVEAAGDDVAWRKAIERAQISTIDAFCSRVLKEHALEARVDPDFRILEPAEAEFELRRIVDETLDARASTRTAQGTDRFLSSFKGTYEYAEESLYSKVHHEFQHPGQRRAECRRPAVRA